MIKQGLKWEKERLLLEEQDRIREIESKERRERLLEMEQLYAVETSALGIDIEKIKSRKYTEPEIDLKNFLLTEREKLTKKVKAGDPFFDVQMIVQAR